MARLRTPLRLLTDGREAREVILDHDDLVAGLRKFEARQLTAWSNYAAAVSHASLRRPLLVRMPLNDELAVGFDSAPIHVEFAPFSRTNLETSRE